MKKKIPSPEKVRKLPRSYGWIDHQILRAGWLELMSAEEICVYTFLVLAADRDGVSFYRLEKMGKSLSMDFLEVSKAIDSLKRKNLISFEPFSTHDPNGFYQVLDIPPKTLPGGESNEVKIPLIFKRTSDPQKVGEIFQKLIGGTDR